jgi:hypothetical protein
MYQIMGLKVFVAWSAAVAAAIAVISAYLSGANDILWLYKSASYGVSGIALMLMIGQSPAFPLLCRLPVVRLVFPDIDGTWEGQMDSNWPVIAERSGLPAGNGGRKTATVYIRARLLHISLKLETHDHYSSSRTVCVRLTRDDEHGDCRLWYVYDNVTRKPEATDTERHYGCAYLEPKSDGRGGLRLDGAYWTNRNWEKGLNTAGSITLKRLPTHSGTHPDSQGKEFSGTLRT